MADRTTARSRITGISSMATRHVLAELARCLRAAVGATGGDRIGGRRRRRAPRRSDGEAFDFVVLAADAIDKLAAGGRIDPGSRDRSRAFRHRDRGGRRARRGPTSAAKRRFATPCCARAASGIRRGRAARTSSRCSSAGASPTSIAPRIVQAPPGVPVGTLVARGDVELGFQQLSELMHVPGIDVIGLLPPEIQVVTVFSAAVCTASNRRAAAEALLAFLASPAADAAKRRHGMEPA